MISDSSDFAGMSKALCDAEIVQLDETECPTGDQTGRPTWDRTGHPTASPTGDQSIEKEHNTGITSVAAGRKESDIQKEAHEYINEQYMSIKAAKRKGRKHYKSTYKSIRKEGRAIPAPLGKRYCCGTDAHARLLSAEERSFSQFII